MLPDQNLISDLMQSSSNLLAENVEKLEPTSTYSKASYYTTLGVYVLSFPGLWSQIKRSTKAKLKRKTYIRYVMLYMTQAEPSAILSDLSFLVTGKQQKAEKIFASKLEKLWHVSELLLVCS